MKLSIRYFLLATILSFSAQLNGFCQTTISGRVFTKDNKPAEGVNIELKDLKLFTITDAAGYFSFRKIENGSYTVVATFTGMQTQQLSVTVSSLNPINVQLTLVENARDLDELVIHSRKGLNDNAPVAGKIAIDPMSLPQSIAVIGKETISDQQSQKLSDVIKNVNGVYLSTTRGNVQESFSARGYGFSSGNMFKNGARVNSGVMPEISSLEKVEVLKGSAAILYGNVAPGGIINMVTLQPKFQKGAEVSIRGGSFGLIKPSVDVYGAVTRNIAARINGTYEKTDSYRDHVTSNRFYINPSLLFNISKRSTFLIQADYLHHNYTPDFGVGSLDNTLIPSLSRSTFLGTTWQYNKARQATVTATLNYKFSENWNLATTLSHQRYARDYYSTERIQAKLNGDWIRPLNKIDSRENYFLAQADLTGNFNTGRINHRLLVGVDADRYNTLTYSFNNPVVYDTINILDESSYHRRNDIPDAKKVRSVETPVHRAGFYVQDLISLHSKIKLLAGIRWSQQNSRPAHTFHILQDSSSYSSSKTDNAFSPRAGIVFQPTKKTSLFASYANSFSINNGTDVFGDALDASIIDQYELGIKNELLKGRLNFNLTFYKIINNNLAQTARFLADGVTPNNNTSFKELVGQTTSNGVEIDLEARPVRTVYIIAGYSYNDMRYTKTPVAKGNYIEGERLVNIPAHTANASIFYSKATRKNSSLKFGAGIYYIGERIAGWNNTYEQAQNYSRQIPVKGFVTADFTIGYSFRNISALVKMSNLFNELNYYVHENYSVNPIAPRQIVSTLKVKL